MRCVVNQRLYYTTRTSSKIFSVHSGIRHLARKKCKALNERVPEKNTYEANALVEGSTSNKLKFYLCRCMRPSNVNRNIECRVSSKTALKYVRLMTYDQHSVTEHSMHDTHARQERMKDKGVKPLTI